MRFADFFTKQRIVAELKAKNKQEAIAELALLMKTSEEMLKYDLFLQDVYSRESLKSTGIGEGVAIPHARTDSVADFVAALGISRSGIEFESIDGKPAQIILVAATPIHKGINGYLRMMSLFTKALSKDSFRQALIKAKTADEIIEFLKKR